MDSSTTLSADPSARRRWPYAGPGQVRVVLAGLAILVGSFLPWVESAVGTFTGMAGPGVWTLYAGVLALAGGVLRRPRLAAANAALAGMLAVGLPLWQGLRLFEVCGGGACAPASGLVLVLAAGLVALAQVPGLWRRRGGTA